MNIHILNILNYGHLSFFAGTDKSDVSDCIKWKARGYCKNNSTYVVYMKANCKYTCDAC